MDEHIEYQQALSEVMAIYQNWLEQSVLVTLKENLRDFQKAYTSLYALFLKKGLVKEDPYKNEDTVGELRLPETAAFSELEKNQQLSIRLASYDNQLEFLVNSYQCTVESFSLDRINRILDMIKYIDWVHLSAPAPNTMAVTELITNLKVGSDPAATNQLNGMILRLVKLTRTIQGNLKSLTNFSREVYKLELREVIGSSPRPSIAEIKKKIIAAKPGRPFYKELAEEILKEDYSEEGPALQDEVLQSLRIEKEKPKVIIQEVSFKPILVEGIQTIGSISASLTEIGLKFDENEILLENRKISVWNKIKQLVEQMLNKKEKPIIYEIEYKDDAKSETSIKKKINFSNLREEINKKAKNLANAGSKNVSKLESLPDEQLIGFLDRAVKDIRYFHKILAAMDDYFKATVDQKDRSRVKGVKPELATIKNAFLKATEKCTEYARMKKGAEQLKPLETHSAG